MNLESRDPRQQSRRRRVLWPVVSLVASLVVLGGAASFVGSADAQVSAAGPPSLLDPLWSSSAESSAPSSSSSEKASSESATPTSSSGAPTPSSGAPVPPSSAPPAPSTPHLPTADPKPGEVEPGPGRAWTLTSSKLTLIGTHYHGYESREVNGKQVKTLHFTVDKLKIKDLVQRGKLGNGKDIKAASAPGLVSTVTEGPIDLYTQKLTGTLNVLGYPAVPVTLSPDSLLLPNLDLSFLRLSKLTFTDAVVHNVKLGGGNLFIPQVKISQE